MLMNQKNICIVLRDGEKRVGFLLAIPHNDAVGELKGDDEFMEQDPKTYHIENVAILPGYRGEKGFVKSQSNSPPPGPRIIPHFVPAGGGSYCRVFGLSFLL
jgi:hypothetical protein